MRGQLFHRRGWVKFFEFFKMGQYSVPGGFRVCREWIWRLERAPTTGSDFVGTTGTRRFGNLFLHQNVPNLVSINSSRHGGQRPEEIFWKSCLWKKLWVNHFERLYFWVISWHCFSDSLSWSGLLHGSLTSPNSPRCLVSRILSRLSTKCILSG